MKKIFAIFLIIITALTSSAFAAEDITVYLNGSKLSFEQPPIIRDDSTLVPFRAIFESLNMSVGWDGAERRVTAKNSDTDITLYIDSYDMTVNGKKVTLITPPIIYNDYTMVPLRAVSEAAGAEVSWDGKTRTVYITEKSGGIETWAAEVFRLTNEERKKAGVNELKWDDTLALFAAAHCEDMITRSFVDHENPDGETPFERLKAYGIEYWTAGENVGAGQTSPEQVVKEWMESPTHRENLLNPNFKSLGVCVMQGGQYNYYWVQEFAWLK